MLHFTGDLALMKMIAESLYAVIPILGDGLGERGCQNVSFRFKNKQVFPV